MKWKGILVAAMLSSIVLWSFNPGQEEQEKEQLILNAVLQYLEALHFLPQDLNDDFSSQVFEEYLLALDPSKRFLIQSEIDELNVYRSQIDNQIKLRNFDFFDSSIVIINEATTRAKSIFDVVINKDLDAVDVQSVEMDRKKRQYSADDTELEQLWTKLIKYDYNNRVKNAIDEQESRQEKSEKKAMTDSGDTSEEKEEEPIKTIEEIKADAKEKIADSYKEWFKRLDDSRRSDRFEAYINSITHIFDPHTDFYNPKEKTDFDIRMGGKLEGIGARLQTSGDFTKVSTIIPGGPAYKGKELEVDDLITAVTQKGGEPLDITGMRLSDVVTHIRGKKGTIVILTVKKVDGSIVDIEIERDEVIIDEGFARSLTLDIPDVVENVGYIKLPKFYSSFEKKNGNSCAKDVAEEIAKLNALNVNAIILDLRNNGGGSLTDVVEMSGLFIEDGPIVQVKPRDKPAYVYEDEDSAVQYDGPLIVMVNQFSASASEILAAAVQDYDRAIVVGSTSTFGKGTVQRFVDLDRAYKQNDLKPLGQLKITMQKFFRVNGGSTQLEGVTPDIIFPDNYHYIETGEKDYEHVMEWTEISPVPYNQDVYKLPAREVLREKSEQRMGQKENFQLVLENAKRLKENRDMTEYPLSYETYSTLIDNRETEAEKYADLFDEKVADLKINNLAVDQEYINSDESRQARNEDWIEGVSKDFYLEETMYILKDMIVANNGELAAKK
jgi:carboxyl-terminal processing protease